MGAGIGAGVNEWVQLVRRARLGATVKLVALVVASYANPDGTKVFPGVARLAVQCEISYSAARRGLKVLRDAGLIELVRRGARKSRRSDEYRLILAEDLLERVDVPTPAAELARIATVNRTNVDAGRRRSSATTEALENSDSHPDSHPGGHLDTVSSARIGSARTVSSATTDPVLALATDRPPSIRPLPENQPPTDDDVRTDVAVTRARGRDDTPRISSTSRTRGLQNIAEAQARRAAARAAHAAAITDDGE